jgi:phosphate/sulfate permease
MMQDRLRKDIADVLAWILTLPAAILIAGCLYMIFRAVI